VVPLPLGWAVPLSWKDVGGMDSIRLNRVILSALESDQAVAFGQYRLNYHSSLKLINSNVLSTLDWSD
jgi:hypothetical protein